jgi:REP element-mobilizing transposase RayT
MCTKNRIPWFGHIQNGYICVSNIGAIIDDEWRKTALIRPYVALDAHVIMPNHFHGIIMIDGMVDDANATMGRNPNHHIEWKPQSLGSIINQFKRICTIRIRETCAPDFAWQMRFHDRIIRDERTLEQVRTYIDDNPKQWKPGSKY